MGLLTDRINNKLTRSNLINEHALNREPVPLRASEVIRRREGGGGRGVSYVCITMKGFINVHKSLIGNYLPDTNHSVRKEANSPYSNK